MLLIQRRSQMAAWASLAAVANATEAPSAEQVQSATPMLRSAVLQHPVWVSKLDKCRRRVLADGDQVAISACKIPQLAWLLQPWPPYKTIASGSQKSPHVLTCGLLTAGPIPLLRCPSTLARVSEGPVAVIRTAQRTATSAAVAYRRILAQPAADRATGPGPWSRRCAPSSRTWRTRSAPRSAHPYWPLAPICGVIVVTCCYYVRPNGPAFDSLGPSTSSKTV